MGQLRLRSRRTSVHALLLAGLATLAACEQSPFAPESESFERVGAAAPASAVFTGNIRIGVVPTSSGVTLGATGGWELVEKATGDVVMTGEGGTMLVTVHTPARIVTIWRLQIICTTPANAELRVAAIEAAGYSAMTELAPAGCVRVFIVYPHADVSFTARNNFRLQMIALGLAPADAFWGSISQVAAAVLQVAGPSTVLVDQAAILRPASGHVTINGLPYRGVAEVGPNSAGTLAGINELPMEEYLYGVVPRELPPVPYGEIEALKAQSVAARTYAMRGLGKRASDGYDLLATTTDQVYGGLAAEHPLSTQAVDETTGIVARYNGTLIEALYSSTSGGFTADNEEVYNSAPVPYLRGVPDANRGNAFANVPTLAVFRNHPEARSLRGFKGGDYEADWSRYHRWTIDWTAQEISQSLSVWRGTNVGTVHAINVLERGPSGRVLLIEYVTDAGTFTHTKDAIRSSLRYYNASGTLSSLLSTLFYIEPVTDRSTKALTGFIAYGGGWGHGVGLSQTGAVGMAEKRASYDEILKHYYRDITLDKLY